MVLGVDWLSQFNLVLFDFKKGSIIFTYNGEKMELECETIKGEIKMISDKEDKCWFRNHNYGMVAQIIVSIDKEQETISLELQTVVDQFSRVFSEPKGLPPTRFNDHRIPLKEGVQPFRLRPYGCPYVQKSEIENMVKEMKESRIIQPSNSPYTSPLLLVKKKDGT